MPLPDRIARLNTNGTQDTGFAPSSGLSDAGLSCCIMADGVIAVGGQFLQAGGASRNRLAFFNADGSLRAENIVVNWDVSAMARQADGRVLVAGRFTTAGGVTYNRIFRLTEARAVEAAFNPNANGSIYALAVAEDGKVYVGGGFTGIGDRERLRLARLLNDDASQALSVVSSSTVRWLRGGSIPASSRVTFEVDTGGGYGAIGGATAAISGGWEVTGLTLSGTGTIRARAYPSDSHSTGIIEETLAFDIVSNMVAVVNGSSISDGGTLAAGSVRVGQSQDYTVNLLNTGLAAIALTGPTPVTKTGTHAAEFTIVSQPALTIQPGESVSFTLRFSPSSEGSKSAELDIATDMAGALANFDISLSGTATAGPGSFDSSWLPVVNGSVLAAVCSDDVTLIGGGFTTVNGLNRGRFARLNSSAAVQTQSGSVSNSVVRCAVEALDGKWFIGGEFTTVNGVSRSRIARINADGSLDTSWNLGASGANAVVYAMALQTDGKIIIGGIFSSLGGQSRNCIARLNADGTLDASFNPDSNLAVAGISIAEDGKIYICGGFTTIGGQSIRHVARLTSAGVLDSTFSHSLSGDGYAYSVSAAPGGGVVVGRATGIERLATTGTAAVGWTNVTGREAISIALQADGKLIAVGSDGVACRRYSLTSGAQDTTWADASVLSRCLSIQPDGKAIVGGTTSVRRILNDDATGSLSVVSSSEIQLLRGGSAPEAQWVRFELSEDGGASWSLLGTGTRTTGGWRLAGTALPQSGQVRARAFCGGGLHDSVVTFSGLPVPDIQVELGAASLAEGATLTFDGRLPGQSSDVTITIRNTGSATLSSLAAAIVTGSANFSVISLGATSLTPGQSTTCLLRCSPPTGTTPGYLSGGISITSNVPGAKAVFSLTLSGAATAAPTASTSTATSITSSAATLRGSVKPNHQTSSVFVEYKRNVDSSWTRSAIVTMSGFSSVAVSIPVTGLSPATVYNYRVGIYNAVNGSASPVYGATVNFTTSA